MRFYVDKNWAKIFIRKVISTSLHSLIITLIAYSLQQSFCIWKRRFITLFCYRLPDELAVFNSISWNLCATTWINSMSEETNKVKPSNSTSCIWPRGSRAGKEIFPWKPRTNCALQNWKFVARKLRRLSPLSWPPKKKAISDDIFFRQIPKQLSTFLDFFGSIHSQLWCTTSNRTTQIFLRFPSIFFTNSVH